MFSKDDRPVAAPNKFCPSMCASHTFFFPCYCALCTSLDLNIFSSTKIHIIELKSNDVVFAKGTSSNKMENNLSEHHINIPFWPLISKSKHSPPLWMVFPLPPLARLCIFLSTINLCLKTQVAYNHIK
jgi:hypothetical protein